MSQATDTFSAHLSQLLSAEGTDSIVSVTDNWMQGRATFGGLAVSLAAQDMINRCAQGRQLRSLTASFIAPTPASRVHFASKALRTGKAIIQATSSATDADGGIVLQTNAIFGESRNTHNVLGHEQASYEPMQAPPLASLQSMPVGMPGLPKFLQNFEVRWSGCGLPMSNTQDTRVGLWVRHLDKSMLNYPEARVISISDLPPPVVLSHYDQPVMASSVSWMLDFIVNPRDVETEWFYLDYELVHAANGYSQQNGRVFDENGTLLTLSRQCMVYFE